MLDNGLFEICDAVSYHSYDHPDLDPRAELSIVGEWRGFLSANGPFQSKKSRLGLCSAHSVKTCVGHAIAASKSTVKISAAC